MKKNIQKKIIFIFTVLVFGMLGIGSVAAQSALPDFKPVSLVVNTTATTTTGAISITGTTQNIGTAAAGASVVFYLSQDQVVSATDAKFATTSFPSIPAGGSIGGTIIFSLPPGVAPGTYYLLAVVDPYNAVLEKNENNNTIVGQSSVTILPPDVDLTLTLFYGFPGTLAKGSTVSFIQTVINKGTVASGSFTVGLYSSPDPTITTSDYLVSRRTIQSLTPGATNATTTTMVVPQNAVAGTYYFGLIVDETNLQAETNENNNITPGQPITILPMSAVTHTGPLILQGNEKMVIKDTFYSQKGPVELRDNAQLIFQNSYFNQSGTVSGNWGLKATGNAQFVMENSWFGIAPWTNFEFHDASSARYSHVKVLDGGFGPWHLFRNNTKLDVLDAPFGGTIWGKSQWHITDSPRSYLEFLIMNDNPAVHPSVDLAGLTQNQHIAQWTFPDDVPGVTGIDYKMSVSSSTVTRWGVSIDANSSLTLRDSDLINVCFPIHGPQYINENVSVSNLRAQYYADFTVNFAQTNLHLLNTMASGWCFNTWNQNTLTVTDSTIDDIRNSGGYSHQIYERVTSNIVLASENMTIVIKDSTINGNVTAQDNSTVTLINTVVKGKITEVGNGRVIVQ